MWKHLSNLNEPFPVTNKSWNKNEQEFNPLSIQIQHKFFKIELYYYLKIDHQLKGSAIFLKICNLHTEK